MKEETIEKLSEVLQKHICTIKKASFDDSRKESMCDSLLKVVDFDKIPNEYARGKGWRNVPKTNDALYISEENDWYFIEFKNGSIDRADIYRKVYDSLVMLLELEIIPNIEFIRQRIKYYLVYNSGKYGKIPCSEGRDVNYGYVWRLAQEEEKLFGIEKLEQFLFNETHTYSKELFEKEFVIPMELKEKV